MDRRIPSNSSAIGRAKRSGIRHRSGAFSPKVGGDGAQVTRRTSLDERGDHTLTLQGEDVEDAERRPSILLVRRPRISSRLPSHFKALPALPFESQQALGEGACNYFASSHNNIPGRDSSLRSSRLLSPAAQEGRTFSPVPLTPRTDRSAGPHDALSPALPTPDYSSVPGATVKRGLTSYFPRTLVPPFFRPRPPAPPRLESDASKYSHTSDASAVVSLRAADSMLGAKSRSSTVLSTRSRDDRRTPVGGLEGSRVPTAFKDKRPLLVSAWSTKDKFTNKFPRPRAVRGVTWSAGVLEEGEKGLLGLEHLERWTLHKWCLVVSVCSVLVYGTIGLVCCILTWFRAWRGADVMYVADYDILVLLTLASSILLLTFVLGISGALLNSRPLLAVYTLLLWPALFSLLAVGYPSYKRYAFALDRKLSLAWSEWYTPLGRGVVQDALRCCGFYNALHERTPSARCYPRSALPGCKGALWHFERASLARVWSAVFALVPVHIVNIVVALVCANHVTRTFGKGITPKRYRLNGDDVRADAEVLMRTLGDVRPVARPGFARAPSSGVYREDKEFYGGRVDEWEVGSKADTVGVGIRRR